MQISNPVLSQFIGTNQGREQSGNRVPARPVTIEGQVLDDENRKDTQGVTQDGFEKESGHRFVLDNEQQQPLIAPVDTSSQASDVSSLPDNLNNNNPTLFSASAQFSANDQGFPFGSRRSFNGLAGNTLAIQNYLNNSPGQSNGSSELIDYFV